MSEENRMPSSESPDRRAVFIDPYVFRAIFNGPPRRVDPAAVVLGGVGTGKPVSPATQRQQKEQP